MRPWKSRHSHVLPEGVQIGSTTAERIKQQHGIAHSRTGLKWLSRSSISQGYGNFYITMISWFAGRFPRFLGSCHSTCLPTYPVQPDGPLPGIADAVVCYPDPSPAFNNLSYSLQTSGGLICWSDRGGCHEGRSVVRILEPAEYTSVKWLWKIFLRMQMDFTHLFLEQERQDTPCDAWKILKGCMTHRAGR